MANYFRYFPTTYYYKDYESTNLDVLTNIISRFSSAVSKFEKGVASGLFGTLGQQSMETEENARTKSNIKLLTDKEVSEIFSDYNLEAKPISVEMK
jgi:hypothetical protein